MIDVAPLTHLDWIALRAAEQSLLRTTRHGHASSSGTPRRAAAIGLKKDPGLDPARLDALAAAGLLEDAHGAEHVAPERGVRQLVATEAGRVEWRCAAVEDHVLAMRMDDLFRREGEMFGHVVRDFRCFRVDEDPGDLLAPEWERSDNAPDDDDGDRRGWVHYRRDVTVPAIANGRGEALTAWNPTPREPVNCDRLGPYPTGRVVTMSGWILCALDAAVRHRLHFEGGHTYVDRADGRGGTAMSSDARNVLLRMGLVGSRIDRERRREDYPATPAGVRFHAVAVEGLPHLNAGDRREWDRYVAAVDSRRLDAA